MQNEQKSSFLRAIQCQAVDCTPVWIMRQAGRYLPEYRAVREQAGNFMNLCQNPELACEVTMQPLRRFDLDAAILFSDILTIPDAMGLGLYFTEGEGPRFKYPVQDEQTINELFDPEPKEKLNYVLETVRHIKQELPTDFPLIGFSGSPWTIATYMVEGGSSKSFSVIKKMLFNRPELLHRLLTVLADSVFIYLKRQIEAGVDTVMIFDTWGGVLGPVDYHDFSLHYMQSIVSRLKEEEVCSHIPIILFTKQAGQYIKSMADTACDVVGVDWTLNIGDAREQVGDKVALQGNMDPAILYASPQRIREEVKKILRDFGPHRGHIFNLGHGIHPDVNPDHVAVLVDAVHDLSA